MCMHLRSIFRITVWLVAVAIVSTLVAPSLSLMAAPTTRQPERVLNQSDEATPPLIEPEGGAAEEEGLLPIGVSEDLGNGGQPEDLPREIAVGDSRFLFDRMVPLSRQDLVRIGQEASLIVYAFTDQAPFDAVYVSTPDRSGDELARFLPERIDEPDVACAAEAASIGTLDAGDTSYAFAGLETDLTPDQLQEVGSSNDQAIYADPDVEQPFPELFVDDDAGLLRFVITDGEGTSVSIAETLAFQGMLFTFVGDVTDQVDAEAVAQVGCAGPWPVYVEEGDPESANRYVRVGERLFLFTGDVAPLPEPTEAPTETPTEVPTEVPTDVPTEVPTEIPTEVPTVEPTESPTEIPTEVPTEEPTAQPTESPTEAPTEAPTESPTVVPTEVPTDSPTEAPIVAPTEGPTEEATVQPTATAEPSPTPEGTEAADPTPQPTVPLQPPAVVPTQAPNVPPPPAVTAEAATTCGGSAGAINAQGLPTSLPGQLQLGGVAYVFAGTASADEVGELTRIGCVGVFEILVTDQVDRAELIYLRAGGDLYRFESALTFNVEFEVVGQPQRIQAEDRQFRLVDTWVPAVYSSTTVILFVADLEATEPEVFYALNVPNNVVGEVIGEYRLAGPNEQPSSDMTAAAERAGIYPDLTIEGRRYLLITVFVPVGTTTNGFVTLFSPGGEGDADMLLGRDVRSLGLFIYDVIPGTQEGG